MALFTVAECDAKIAVLKEKLYDVLGVAEKEKIEEGNTRYEVTKQYESIVKQLEFFDRQKSIATEEENSAGSTDKSVSFLARREYGN